MNIQINEIEISKNIVKDFQKHVNFINFMQFFQLTLRTSQLCPDLIELMYHSEYNCIHRLGSGPILLTQLVS